MADTTSTTKDIGSKSLLKALSFKNDVKSKLVRKKSVSSGDRANKHDKRKSFKRTGSFNNNLKKDFFEAKNDLQRIEENCKKILQSINYVNDVINKEILEMLPGSISIILEILIDADSILSTHPKDKHLELRGSYKLLLESLSCLMKWSDRKLFLEDPMVSFNKKEGREYVEKLKNAAKEFLQIASVSLKVSSNDDNISVKSSEVEKECPKTAGILEKFKTLDLTSTGPQVHSLLLPVNACLSYSADNILDDKPPPKPPMPQQLMIPSWNFHNGFILGDEITRRKGLPPALPTKSRGGSLLSDSHSDSRSNASADVNHVHSTEFVHRSPTNSLNSILSASSEEYFLDDAPPKPSRSPERREGNAIEQPQNTIATTSTFLSPHVGGGGGGGCAKISFHSFSTSVVQRTVTSSYSSRSHVECIGESDGAAGRSMDAKKMVDASSSSSSSCTTESNRSSSFVSVIKESISEEGGRVATSSFVSSNYETSSSSVNGGVDSRGGGEGEEKNFDPNVPPPLPPKQKPVETYMSIFGSSTPVGHQDSLSNFSNQVILRRQHHQVHSFLGNPSINFFQDKYFQFHVDLYGLSGAASPQQRGSYTTSASSHSSGLFSSETGSTHDGDSTPPSLPPKTGIYNLCIDATPSTSHAAALDAKTPEYTNFRVSEEEEELNLLSGSTCIKDLQETKDAPPILDLTGATDHLVFKKSEEEGPEVRAGSVDALIVHATVSDFMFQEAFLMTYRTFLPPQELMRKLIYRYNLFGKKSNDSGRKYSRNSFSLIVRVLDDICIDTDCDVLETMVDLSYHLIRRFELKQAQKLRERCVAKLKIRQQRLKSSKTPLSSYQVTSKCHSVLEFKSLHMAEQMTLLDFELFKKIDISEILLWSRQQKEELSPNLTKFTEHFNRMSYWCRTQILERDDTKEREKYLVKFIKIMKHLRQLNNFHSYLAILSALDSAPVRRLDWQKNHVEALKEFCQLIDSSSSFRAYRQTLAETKPPCIPYIGLILQDLTFIHIGNPDLDYEGRINFNKCWQLFAIIDTMCRFKRSTKYNFKRNEKILSFFNNFDSYLSEDSLWQISEIIKPRQKKQSKSVSLSK